MVTSKKEYKQVLHREVIRFLTGSGKTIRNNWKDRNEMEQKKIHLETGKSEVSILKSLLGGKRVACNKGGNETGRAEES